MLGKKKDKNPDHITITKAKEVDGREASQEYASVLESGEEVLRAFKSRQDLALFTNLKLIVIKIADSIVTRQYDIYQANYTNVDFIHIKAMDLNMSKHASLVLYLEDHSFDIGIIPSSSIKGIVDYINKIIRT
jgi:hypothetical protein